MATRSEEWFERARRVIPGGVNSPVRAWGAVRGTPRFIVRASGATVTDSDGRDYLDYVGSWGPMILGHAHPRVTDAIVEAARAGSSFGAATEREVKLAETVCERIPSVEQLRLVSSGTEATMTALRLARAHTGRDLILKFAGCYHGHSDGLLVRAGSGALTFGVPTSAGVPAGMASLTLVADFNDTDGVRRFFAEKGREIAGVIVEPVAGNMGVVPPADDFLETLRALTAESGSVLVFDEVMTGFRLAAAGAQERYGVRPDLTCLGKVLGGGLPLAAVGGSRAIMGRLAPEGPVYQAGTLSGNPLAVAAGSATLCELEGAQPYGRLEELGARLEKGLRDVLQRRGIRGCVNRVGSMWTLFLGTDAVRGSADIETVDARAFGRFFHGMCERGVFLPPSAYEAAFISLAHRPEDIDRTVEAAEQALAREEK